MCLGKALATHIGHVESFSHKLGVEAPMSTQIIKDNVLRVKPKDQQNTLMTTTSTSSPLAMPKTSLLGG